MDKTFEKKFKKEIYFLKTYVKENTGKNKLLLPHLLRVGEFLFKEGYSKDIITAGLLHDMLEWTECTKQIIQKKYGKHILDIVKANIKNRNIENSRQRKQDCIDRCAKIGTDALIVKAADTLDSYNWYIKIGNEKKLKGQKVLQN